MPSNTPTANRHVPDLEFGLTDEQKKAVGEALEILMCVYGRKANNPFLETYESSYFEGVSDGLNHAYKLVHGRDDDYNHKDG